MRRSRMTRERFFALNQFDGIIYACTKTAKIESIYSPQFGVIVVESDTKPIENRIRPLEGNSCKFSAYYKEGRWYANRITVMSSPPLQLERKPDRCVMKGIAVVCGVHDTIAWLWSDILGRVLVKQELAKDLSSLTCVEFRAMKCSIREPSVGYEAVSVTVMNEKVFLSEILRFKGSVTVEENGLARINEQLCVLLVDDSRAEEPLMRGAQLLPAGSKASLLYFEHYDGNADELVSVFITQKSKIVEGISDGAFSTRRYPDRMQQVYHIGRLPKEDESHNLLIFRCTDEEPLQEPAVVAAMDSDDHIDGEKAVENKKREQRASSGEDGSRSSSKRPLKQKHSTSGAEIERNGKEEVMAGISEETKEDTSVFETMSDGLFAGEGSSGVDNDSMELSEDFLLDADLFDKALIEEYLREKRLRFKCARRRCAEDEASSKEELLRVEGLSSDCRVEETEEALAKEPIKDNEHVEHEEHSTMCCLEEEEPQGEERQNEQPTKLQHSNAKAFVEGSISAGDEERVGELVENEELSEVKDANGERSDSECDTQKNDALVEGLLEIVKHEDATVRYTKNGISDKQELSNTDCSKEEMNAVAEAPVTAAKQDIADECKMVRSDHLPDWSDAMNSLDAQTPEIEHFLVCILKAYESDEMVKPNEDATVRYTKNGISDKQELSNTDCSKEEMNAVAEAPVTAAKQDIADECKMVRSDHLPDWSDAMNSLDAQTPEIEHFLVCILKAYESDEMVKPNEENAYKEALKEFLTELVICMDIGRHIIASPKGSRLMVAISDYVCGNSMSLDELFEFTSESSPYNYGLVVSEYESDAILGILICELLRRYVPNFVEMAFANCASLAEGSAHYELLSRLFSQLSIISEKGSRELNL